MKRPALPSLATVVMFALASVAAGADAPTPVIIQLTPEGFASASFRADLGSRGRTGLSDLDGLLAEAGATQVTPALRFPPVADNEPARRLRRYLRVEYAGARGPTEVAALLRRSIAVAGAEPEVTFFATFEPDDPLFPSQWAHRNTGQAVAYNGSLVGTPDADTDTELAWDLTAGASSVVIAIIDSGVDLGHAEFAGRLVAGYDFVNDDVTPMDDYGHGTCCAGIAAARGDNNQGVAGVAWGPRIMPVKVLNANGNGYAGPISSGIVWAADHGARVFSLSLGSYTSSALIEDAVAYAHDLGLPVFCAAGNDNLPYLTYPAAYTASTIPVGALSPCNGRKSPTSCDGEDYWGSNYGALAFLAPGVRLHSTDITGQAGYTPDDYTAEFNGTSAAAPHAAAIGALVLSLNPALSPDVLEYRLTHASEDLGPHGTDLETGYGRLNAHLAVLSAFAVPMYVDAGYAGLEWGTLHEPYNTLGEGLYWASDGSTIVMFPGTYPQNLTIDRPMTIMAKDGIARIGQ